MNINIKKLTALLLATLMVLALAACGAKDAAKTPETATTEAAAADTTEAATEADSEEPKNEEEATALYNSLMNRENEILSENTALWEKVFLSADKGMAMLEDGKNYGDFLLDTIESAKKEFTDDELAMLKEGAAEISRIENQLTALEEKYPNIVDTGMGGGMSVPADSAMQKFPAFEGKDLEGNVVKSDELFSKNAVTVVNFWFTTCSPCVGELSDLEALSKTLTEKAAPSSVSTASPWTATRVPLPMQRKCCPRRAQPIPTCISIPTARPVSSPPTSLPSPPPMW